MRSNTMKTIACIAASLLLVILLNVMFRWDKAEIELARQPDHIHLLLSSHSSSGYDAKQGQKTFSRSDSYLILPLSLRLPYTVSIQESKGKLSLDEHPYGFFWILLTVFVVFPLMQRLAEKLGFKKVTAGLG